MYDSTYKVLGEVLVACPYREELDVHTLATSLSPA
jgi:hypothetical protein